MFKELEKMTVPEVLEAVAQMLYDQAEISGRRSSNAFNEDIIQKFETESQTFCAAAEYVRRMNGIE